MRLKIIFIPAVCVLLVLSFTAFFPQYKTLEPIRHFKDAAEKQLKLPAKLRISEGHPLKGELTSLSKIHAKHEASAPPKAIKGTFLHKIALMKIPFDQLPGWNKADLKKSLTTFQTSCKTFLKQDPKQHVGSQHIDIKAGDWRPACNAALPIDSFSTEKAKKFFEKWFSPVEFKQPRSVRGLFTGYFMPRLKGSLTRTKKYNTPIYGLPTRAHSSRYSHLTRAQIDQGALSKQAPVIAWINSPIERQFLEVEGSGVIHLTNGKRLYLGYAGENGAHYTSLENVLIRKGIMTKHTASKKAIKHYLESHPKTMNTFLHKNKSFVFFEDLKKPMALGVRGMALTPGYSLAVDKRWIPLGAPLWLETMKPDMASNNDKKFQRLMIAQDTGGAIRGMVRGDVYWGSGKKAAYLGGHMKTKGRYWLLLPNRTLDRNAT